MFLAKASGHGVHLTLLNHQSVAPSTQREPAEHHPALVRSRLKAVRPRKQTYVLSLILEFLYFFRQLLFLWIAVSIPILETLSSDHTKYGFSD